MATMWTPCSAANSSRSARRAMLPSARMISQITPAGKRPAALHEVDDRLCLTGPFEHTTGCGAERKGVPGLGEIAGPGVLVAEQPDGGGAVER